MVIAVFLVLVIIVNVSEVCSYSFNINDVKVISDDSLKDTYFSYSLLLQQGINPRVIVGAPKNTNLEEGGSVYICDIFENVSSPCKKLNTGTDISTKTPNGNFFGSSLDGEDQGNGEFVACAPRFFMESGNAPSLGGLCLHVENSSSTTKWPSIIYPLKDKGRYPDFNRQNLLKKQSYYAYTLSMMGFDVSFYSSETAKELLLGGVGANTFSGATFTYNLKDQSNSVIPNDPEPPNRFTVDTYLGYSVTTAKFMQGSNHTWFVVGAPRGNSLTGKVNIIQKVPTVSNNINIIASFQGDEVGSYFGASLLALDVSNDGLVDLLIGAPMSAGATWDEGMVYFYKGLKATSYLSPIKLTGSRKIGGRFGSAIVTLGDFDLDGFNDVAISAPYEDNGRGAVYIYRGSSEGLKDDYSQRISPADFKSGPINVRAFGMGLARGNDIDNNGHNDIAIGAYRTGQVFIIKSYPIIDYNVYLFPSVATIIKNTSAFSLELCILYTKRTEKQIISQVGFDILFNLDYRSIEKKINDNIKVNVGEKMCKNYTVTLKESLKDISSFLISLKLEVDTKNIIAHGKREVNYQIPYSHLCGDDNICNTGLSVSFMSKTSRIILGEDKTIDLEVTVSNDGEPAYQCELIFEVPESIELRSLKDCIKNNQAYICLMDDILISNQSKSFVFDIKTLTPDKEEIEIKVNVSSLGVNSNTGLDKDVVRIPVILNSTANIIGQTIPTSVEIEVGESMQDIEISHQFSLGKTGPSPLKVDIHIFIPVVEFEENVFEILDLKGSIDNVDVSCVTGSMQTSPDLDVEVANIPLNRSIIVSCTSGQKCVEYSCQEVYLYNSGQLAIFDVKMLLKPRILVSKFKNELKTRDIVAFVPISFQKTETDSIVASSPLVIFVRTIKYVPLWIYLVAAIIGVLLLLLVSYGLYKCHFFDRNYKDKLRQEKILDSSENTIADEIFNEEVFQPMKDKL